MRAGTLQPPKLEMRAKGANSTGEAVLTKSANDRIDGLTVVSTGNNGLSFIRNDEQAKAYAATKKLTAKMGRIHAAVPFSSAMSEILDQWAQRRLA